MMTLKKGSTGADVKSLQTQLGIVADGVFGSVTEAAVMHYQRSHGLTADGIVGANTWNVLMGNQKFNQRCINEIIIHCSATPEGKDVTVEQIRDWHVRGNGWSDIGYHWIIYRDGSVHAGRPESKKGAHCNGHNANSIGICYVGGEVADGSHTPKDTRTPAQKVALIKLVNELRQRYPGATVHGHNEFAAKACPSFDVKKEFK